MRPSNALRLAMPALLVGLLLLSAPAPARAQGVHAALLPALQNVEPGNEFEITIDVSQSGSQFNGFEAVVQYDPAALTFLQQSPVSVQQGCLMTGACSAACGNTFHLFSAAGDSVAVNDLLLCNQITLTGPGHLYVLRFRASSTSQITFLTFHRTRFYNGGLFVNPVTAVGCRVDIGSNLDVGGPDPVAGLRLRAAPNPAFGRITLGIRSDAPGLLRVDVLDISGRTVRHLSQEWTAGESRLEWNGRDDAGNRMAAGVYLIRARLGARSRQTRVTLLQ
jgi:hypothetical protein